MKFKNPLLLIRFTVQELVQRKTLQVLFLLFFLFCFSIPLWKHFSPESEVDFLINMGTGLAGFFLLIATVVIGGDLIPRDLESRRLLFFYMHPVSKIEYLLGRALGTFLFLSFSFALFMALLKLLFIWKAWPVAFWPSVFLLIKYLVLCAFLFWISPLVERFTAIFLGLAFFFIASSLSTFSFLAHESGRAMVQFWIDAAGVLFPHFELFDAAVSREVLESGQAQFYIAKTLAYGGWFIAVYLFFAYLALRKRNL